MLKKSAALLLSLGLSLAMTAVGAHALDKKASVTAYERNQSGSPALNGGDSIIAFVDVVTPHKGAVVASYSINLRMDAAGSRAQCTVGYLGVSTLNGVSCIASGDSGYAHCSGVRTLKIGKTGGKRVYLICKENSGTVVYTDHALTAVFVPKRRNISSVALDAGKNGAADAEVN